MRTLLSLCIGLCLGYSALAQDSFQTYLTSDLAIHSTFKAWEKFETSCLDQLKSGKLTLFRTNGKAYNTEETSRLLVLPAYDPVAKDTLYFPIERLYFRSRNDYLELFHPNAFLGDTHEIGWVKKIEALNLCPEPAASVLEGMMRYSDFFSENRAMEESTIYTYGMLAFDSLQKVLEAEVRVNKKLRAYYETGRPMPDTVVMERISELKDIDMGEQGFSKAWLGISNQQKYKGFLVSGHLDGRELKINHWGLLIHPEWKYAGWNPGKIPWFFLSDHELAKHEKAAKRYLDGLFYFAQLYLLDPENIHPFFKTNRIPIQNNRNPHKN